MPRGTTAGCTATFTRLCVNCQAEAEKEAKASRNYDDERAYRKLGVTDVDEENT